MKKSILVFISLLFLIGCASNGLFMDYGESSNAEPEFQWPVYGAVVTQKFRPLRKKTRRRHQGIDLSAHYNSPIFSVDNGLVTYAGSGHTGYGRLVIVQHTNGYKSYYAHLSQFKTKRGAIVKKGDLLGLMGRSGRATGVHLHFELRKKELALNPLDLLPTEAINALNSAP
jgi:murein DD-endopeptidase MepM/ murein hydrolase activator NlpD